ncbi:hypothetical protein PR048_011989 [Dryococelus australis]|uniref:DDE Tnp4 domain-containing protein n=1 Tax=Dryococelus australis TaxID=614101 RepID=A0ABQ9HNS1_9NEOP|nr:hypothetical protein PR048_011989 [Dryococelus australis]
MPYMTPILTARRRRMSFWHRGNEQLVAVLTKHSSGMDPIILYAVYKKMYPNRQKIKWSVHPINSARYVDGAFRNLYLASRCTYTDLHYVFRIGLGTASVIVPQMCKVVWAALCSVVFPEFTQNYWYYTTKNFKNNVYFPHYLGAIDGKHVHIIKPEHSGSLIYNYKQYFSVVLLAVADANYRFMYIDVGAIGKAVDCIIFHGLTFHKALQVGSLNIPKPERVTNALGPLPYVFVTDEAFGISVNMIRPYPGNNSTDSKRIFNHRLSTARLLLSVLLGCSRTSGGFYIVK